MQGFRKFIEEQKSCGYIHIEASQIKKPWRGKPEEVIAKWQDLPVTPIYMDPVPTGYKGR